MSLRPEVVNAFEVLGLSPDVHEAVASRAYKKLALLHHPDRNHGDEMATARFQQIGAAWEICSRHYDDPVWSRGGPSSFDDDDDDFDDDDIPSWFYEFVFREFVMGRKFGRFRAFRRESGRPYVFVHPKGFRRDFPSDGDYSDSIHHVINNEIKQQKEKEEYENRVRQFEAEIQAEEREMQRIRRQEKLDAERRASACVRIFELARQGNSSAMKSMIEDEDIDVNVSERDSKQKRNGQQKKYETLLHVAASHCTEDLVLFLLEKGANSAALNQANLTPFQVAVLSGNIPVAQFFISHRAKSDGCHPSKAAADGRTPLQLAIESESMFMVELVLKHATVHDAHKCWQRECLLPGIKDVLKTKKGFVPPEEARSQPPMSNKARQKAEAAQREAEKKKRILEEQVRAKEDLYGKKKRAERRKLEKQAKEKAQRAEIEQDGTIEEAKDMAWLELESQEEGEEAARPQDIQFGKRAHSLQEAIQETAALPETVNLEGSEFGRDELSQAKPIERKIRTHGETQDGESHDRISPYSVHRRLSEDPEAKRIEGLRRLQAQVEEHERRRLRRERATAGQVTDSSDVFDTIMLRRAQRSAHDEEHRQRDKDESEEARRRASEAEATRLFVTPSSSPLAPLFWSKETRSFTTTVSSATFSPEPSPEDMQTCAIPDDLFAYEPHVKLNVSNDGLSVRGSERGRGRGRGHGWRGRGRSRGQGSDRCRPRGQ